MLPCLRLMNSSTLSSLNYRGKNLSINDCLITFHSIGLAPNGPLYFHYSYNTYAKPINWYVDKSAFSTKVTPTIASTL